MEKEVRKYKGSDVDMLSTSAVITEQGIARKPFLITKRATWVDPFFPNLKTRINSAFTNILGIDNAAQLRNATSIIYGVQKTGMTLLAEFKVQVSEDFKNNKPRRNEILTVLGFTLLLKKVQKKDQEALVQLLYQFKLNMTAAMKSEIVSAGTAQSQITDIIALAEILKNANITQETVKDSKPEVTQNGVKELNEIYSQVISVAKIAAKFYVNNKAIKDEFSFSKTMRNLNRQKPNDKGGETPPPAQA